MITIIDFGMGNLRSIQHKLEKAGVSAEISSDLSKIEESTKLILPGVGHFSTGMRNLEAYNLIGTLNKKVLEDKVPILGICLGMQLFTKSSEEGHCKGLGWISAETMRFSFDPSKEKIRIPHVGWNTVDIKSQTSLFENVDILSRFYFTHSYYVQCEEAQDVVANNALWT